MKKYKQPTPTSTMANVAAMHQNAHINKTQLRCTNTNTNTIQQQCGANLKSGLSQRYQDRRTEKTIQQLKESIGSIQKMIKTSQQLLRNTKPLKHRQVRSDSLQLRLKFDHNNNNNNVNVNNNSKQKSLSVISNLYNSHDGRSTSNNKDNNKEKDKQYQLNQLSATTATIGKHLNMNMNYSSDLSQQHASHHYHNHNHNNYNNHNIIHNNQNSQYNNNHNIIQNNHNNQNSQYNNNQLYQKHKLVQKQYKNNRLNNIPQTMKPQKLQPSPRKRTPLFIDTGIDTHHNNNVNMNLSPASFGRTTQKSYNTHHHNNNNNSNIFIHDSTSPVSAITRYRQAYFQAPGSGAGNYYDREETLEDSFADSLENPFHFARRMKTQALNDSYQRSLLGESLERYSTIQRKSQMYAGRDKQNQNMPVKKIVLKRKKNNNLNLNYLRTFAQLEQQYKKPKSNRAFDGVKIPNKVKQGKYSYFQVNPQPCITKADIKNISQKLDRQRDRDREKQINNLGYTGGSFSRLNNNCPKFNKENSKTQLEQFYDKVKKYGFVERYLTFNQIGCIFQYLKKSAIPEHKWPLYVVDKVYQKMENLSKVKST